MVTSVWIIQLKNKPIYTHTHTNIFTFFVEGAPIRGMSTTLHSQGHMDQMANLWLTSLEVMHKNKNKTEINLQAL